MPHSRYRKRSFRIPGQSGEWFNWTTGSSTGTTPLWLWDGVDEIGDTNHGRRWMEIPGSDKGDDFWVEHRYIQRSPSPLAGIFRSPVGLAYKGHLTAKPESQVSDIDTQKIARDRGAQLWDRAKPAQPNFMAANALYELKDVPGMLKQRFDRNRLSTIGDFYLALKFGWEPLLRDVRDFTLSTFTLHRTLQQLLRDNGKAVRRTASLPKVILEDWQWSGQAYNAFEQTFVTQCYVDQPSLRTSGHDEYQARISARFRYWLPTFRDSWEWDAMMYGRIFGLKPSPKVVYNAIPWSWLIDYFGNVGHVVSNMDAGVADRLAADYAYVTVKRKSVRRSEASGTFYKDTQGSKQVLSAYTDVVYDQTGRVHATPFGFSINENSLTLMQMSILGALGLSRLKRVGG